MLINSAKKSGHVAIIMDGNSRWARQRNLKTIEGHKQGVKRLRDIVKYSAKSKISHLSVFAFSTENWKRSASEVSDLMKLFLQSIIKEVPELIENKVQLNFIGDIPKFSKSLISQINSSMKDTQVSNPNLILNVAISYGGRWDILNAIKGLKDHKININKITEDEFSNLLSTSNFPDPDLLIRTGNEIRISNFFLWQISYSELYFSKLLWPDFKLSNFKSVLKKFYTRDRRFGKQ